MKIILGLFDRLLFTLGVLLFLQLPQFLDQYTQRAGGYYDAERAHLAQYQSMADASFAGDLQGLIASFKTNPNAAIAQTGKNIEAIKSNVIELERGIRILESTDLIRKLVYLLSGHIDLDLAEGTLRAFQPGIPLTTDAILCGAAGGLVFTSLFNGMLWLPKRSFTRNGSRRKLVNT